MARTRGPHPVRCCRHRPMTASGLIGLTVGAADIRLVSTTSTLSSRASRAFLRGEVVNRHQSSPLDLTDPWQVYGPDGRFRDEVLALMREVREASARAGYYTMVVPEHLGGAGLGFEALYRVWEAIYHQCGPQSLAWLSRRGPLGPGAEPRAGRCLGVGPPGGVGRPAPRQQDAVLLHVRTRRRIRRVDDADPSRALGFGVADVGHQAVDHQRSLRRLRRGVRRHRSRSGGGPSRGGDRLPRRDRCSRLPGRQRDPDVRARRRGRGDHQPHRRRGGTGVGARRGRGGISPGARRARPPAGCTTRPARSAWPAGRSSGPSPTPTTGSPSDGRSSTTRPSPFPSRRGRPSCGPPA